LRSAISIGRSTSTATAVRSRTPLTRASRSTVWARGLGCFGSYRASSPPPGIFIAVISPKRSSLIGRLNSTPFVDSFKTELIRDRVWRTRSELELAIVTYVAWFNNQRLHESLGDLPPAEFEALHEFRYAAATH
jgi:putative transposase